MKFELSPMTQGVIDKTCQFVSLQGSQSNLGGHNCKLSKFIHKLLHNVLEATGNSMGSFNTRLCGVWYYKV